MAAGLIQEDEVLRPDRRGQDIDACVEQLGGYPVIMKILQGTQGVGVILAETDASAKSIIEAFTAASELAWYAEVGIPGAIFGPGRIAQAHSPDEYVEIEQLVSACKAMALTAAAWCGGATEAKRTPK